MKRPLAYISAAWKGTESKITKEARTYCRAAYEAGFSPICPRLYLPLYIDDAKNCLIIGGSGSGKTRFWLKPNLLQLHSSYAVTDPKGLVFRGRKNPHKTRENPRVCRRWHYARSNENHRIVRAFEP